MNMNAHCFQMPPFNNGKDISINIRIVARLQADPKGSSADKGRSEGVVESPARSGGPGGHRI